MMDTVTLFGSVSAVILILILAYWCSRALGKTWGRGAMSREIQVIDQLQVGQDRRILLIRLRDHNYLIGVSQAGIELLAEPEGEFLPPDRDGEKEEAPSFKEVLRGHGFRRFNTKGGER